MLRRLSTCLLALVVAVAYATSGEGRAVAAAGSWSWDAAVDAPVIGAAQRSGVRPARPSEGAAPTRLPAGTLPAASWRQVLAGARPAGAPAALASRSSVLLETSRSARGPPAPTLA